MASPGKRFPRRDIRGTEGIWRVNAAGSIYKYDRLQPIGEDVPGLPTIDFGHRYITDTLIVPAYLGPVPSSGRRTDTCRLLDEIMSFAFHGYPPGGFSSSRVVHLDSDSMNCAAENLYWEVDCEYTIAAQEKTTRQLMRPDFLPRKPPHMQADSQPRKDIAWVESFTLPGWKPVAEKVAC
jgi:hypothetical protein